MASNTVTPKKASPLAAAGLERLSPIVYLYRPSVTDASAAPISGVAPPKIIFLGAWMGAAEAHIAKYVTRYQALYPSAQIVLGRFEPRHFNSRVALRELGPAVAPIRAALDPASRTPEVLVHVLSNGGSSLLHHLYALFRATAAKAGVGPRAADETDVFPLHTTFFDSAPGTYSYFGSVTAFTIGVKGWMRLLLVPLAHLGTIAYFLFYLPGLLRTDPLCRMWASHNDVLRVREVRRTYVYSESDRIVDYRHIEKHAKEAKEYGFDVRKEKFEGSQHVSHARKDDHRYWRLVKETWEGVD